MKIKEIIRGEVLLKKWFTRNIFLFLLIAVLWLVYIANRYRIETTVRQIENTNKEIKELELKRTSVKTRYQRLSTMMELEKALSPVGVGISREPIKKVILISENE
ncbi:MAG: hypothetical protein IKV46_02900 [Bacteroidales bacterium]|jgi:hypothetical protein|nr:hypothetical protein [Bacteroidales bacterium]